MMIKRSIKRIYLMLTSYLKELVIIWKFSLKYLPTSSIKWFVVIALFFVFVPVIIIFTSFFITKVANNTQGEGVKFNAPALNVKKMKDILKEQELKKQKRENINFSDRIILDPSI